MNYESLNSEVLADYNSTENQIALKERYHLKLITAMNDRLESNIGMNDPYWEELHKWRVLQRMIDGSHFR